MPMKPWGPAFAAGVLACFNAWPQSQPGKQLSARELFYAAPVQPAAAKAPPAKAPPTKAAPRHAKAKPTPKGEAAKARPAPSAAPAPAAAGIIPVAHAPASRVPLGLRYTILKRVEGTMVEVAPDSSFRAGDRIQISVEANDAGFLYIVHQGSSGTWKPLFPSEEIAQGDNRVEKGRAYVMPPGSRFYFDEQAGEEKLFLILSRTPEPDLEKIIYSLQTGAPAASPEPVRKLYASAGMRPIDDAVVGRLRNVYARDLVIEKIDEDASGPRKEKAVYVVNPTGSPDSRVVADIRLVNRGR